MLDWVQKKKKPLESIISCEPHLMSIASPYHSHYTKVQLSSVRAMICTDEGLHSQVHSPSYDSIKIFSTHLMKKEEDSLLVVLLVVLCHKKKVEKKPIISNCLSRQRRNKVHKADVVLP